jgi:hypothetical protein
MKILPNEIEIIDFFKDKKIINIKVGEFRKDKNNFDYATSISFSIDLNDGSKFSVRTEAINMQFLKGEDKKHLIENIKKVFNRKHKKVVDLV